MAKVGETVAGSTEPIILTLKVEGVALNLDAYVVDSIVLVLSDGTAVAVAGTIVAVANQTVNTGKVSYTPDATDLDVGAALKPRESEKHWTRVLVLDGAGVPKYFPHGPSTDWIDVYRP